VRWWLAREKSEGEVVHCTQKRERENKEEEREKEKRVI
jgi:hypothetical protein